MSAAALAPRRAQRKSCPAPEMPRVVEERDDGHGVRRREDGPEPVPNSTTGSGGPDQTLKFSRSVKSTSFRLIFGRIDCSRRVLDAEPKMLRRNYLVRSN